MSEPIQLDLFDEQDAQTVLNGMYYEQSSGKFVSYVLGRRHFEVTPGRCLGDKEWKERIMRERAI
ncbi:hypothetical protein [Paenibacillus glucanolyticus]|uniref:hypothetical protein n=1 Tax=Paenibacillus glucanolyticus TaxID=59843 RepID=UPI00128CD668|nr:hypothetical protein [Paenibacillus glucanolyticus]MPY20266.1 hypothetical protein [Paenibacillus glucanolyticus]